MFLYQNVRNVLTIFQSRFALEEIAPDLSSSRDEFGTFSYVPNLFCRLHTGGRIPEIK